MQDDASIQSGQDSQQTRDTLQTDEPATLPNYIHKSGPEINVSDTNALLSHPGPIVISYRQFLPCKTALYYLRGLLFGVEPHGDLIWVMARPGGPLSIHFQTYSGLKQAFIENDEISARLTCAKYVEAAVDAAETRWAGDRLGDQSHGSWLDEQRNMITDCVVWGLRKADARLLGMRGPKAMVT